MRILTLSCVFVLMNLLGGLSAQAGDGLVQKTSQWSFGDSQFSAGQDVTVDSKVPGSLTVAGETVTVTDQASIAKDAWIAGRRVAVEGMIGRDLTIRAQDALINGPVKGDVAFYGMNLSFGPDARIDGEVNYYSASKAQIDESAKITGPIHAHSWRDEPVHMGGMMDGQRMPHDDRVYNGERGWMHEGGRYYTVPGYEMSLAGAVFFGLLAGLVVIFGAGHADNMSEAAFANPLLAMMIGFVWLAGTPVLAVMSAITIIGLPLAGILLLLWPLGVVMGLVVSIAVLSRFISARLGAVGEGALGGLAGIVIATGIVWVFIHAPIAGGLFWLIAVCLGIGAMALGGRVQYVRL